MIRPHPGVANRNGNDKSQLISLVAGLGPNAVAKDQGQIWLDLWAKPMLACSLQLPNTVEVLLASLGQGSKYAAVLCVPLKGPVLGVQSCCWPVGRSLW